MPGYTMPDCPPLPKRVVVTDRRQQTALGGNHHSILFIDRAELQKAFGDPWYDSWDNDPDTLRPHRSDYLVFSGCVDGVGLRVFREAIYGIHFWTAGCTLPLGWDDRGVSYQDWSKHVIETLCPSVVWGFGPLCRDRDEALARSHAQRQAASVSGSASGAGP